MGEKKVVYVDFRERKVIPADQIADMTPPVRAKGSVALRKFFGRKPEAVPPLPPPTVDEVVAAKFDVEMARVNFGKTSQTLDRDEILKRTDEAEQLFLVLSEADQAEVNQKMSELTQSTKTIER